MGHLSEGVLRRLFDEPLAISNSDREHLGSCARCRRLYTEIGEAARQTSTLFDTTQHAVDSAMALRSFKERVARERVQRRSGRWTMARFRPSTFFRPAIGAAALIAALVGAVTLTPAGSLAQQLITIFQPTSVVAVPISSEDLRTLPDLAKYGTVHAPQHLSDRTVSGPAEASASTGMTVVEPSSLPAGVPSDVSYHVLPGASGSFTFSAAIAQRYAAAHHVTLPAMPKQIDGSTLQISTGNAALTIWGGHGSMPALVVGQMKAPVVQSAGVSVQQLENYVFSLPGVSTRLALAIRAIGNPASTLPLPIPTNLAQSHSVTVQGVQGLAIGDTTGIGSAVVWQKAGIFHGVGGTITEDQALAVANSLK